MNTFFWSQKLKTIHKPQFLALLYVRSWNIYDTIYAYNYAYTLVACKSLPKRIAFINKDQLNRWYKFISDIINATINTIPQRYYYII